ncbi:MAG: Eco57I restriction-modification methylase domain-containing protein [Candidatus Nanopelagicales bacterium]|nr:Eco57I restriction-modification methylase domain-containing protein [Candidatus Nanopelagicales bacterium]
MPAARELRDHAESRRLAALSGLETARQAQLGQHFTPVETAELMASLPELPASGVLRVLDPGAGAGILTAALVARVLDVAPELSLELVAVETDAALIPHLGGTLEECRRTATATGTQIQYQIVQADFIESLTSMPDGPLSSAAPFDLTIMNPPYGKLAASSVHRRALARNGLVCPNLYAAFLALGVSMLKRGGQVVAITPRSFTNGPYFGEFRRKFLSAVALNDIHTYASRSRVFAESGVLQETVIIRATKGGNARKVRLSMSADHRSLSAERLVSAEEVVHPEDPHKFIRIVGSNEEQTAIDALGEMPGRLGDLGISVSTGRVVDFRARRHLLKDPTPECAPLVYPGNCVGGVVIWPRDIRKPQGFRLGDDLAARQVVPNGTYVVVKRFSTKEERRRIVAAVWDGDARGHPAVAFENHLNVFHQAGAGIDRDLAVGLSYWLNSTLIDRFFRTFSGHTQVNVADIRALPFPSPIQLVSLGQRCQPQLPGQAEIDSMVTTAFGL